MEVKQHCVRDEATMCKEQSKITKAAMAAAKKLELIQCMIFE